jgi:hypothetical protein
VNSANLTFALGTNTTSSGTNDFGSPSYNSTYMNVSGGVSFGGNDSVSLVDLTNTNGSNGTLSLRTGTPYLLIHDSLGDAGFDGLITMTGAGANAVYTLDGNGYVVGVLSSYGIANDYTGGTGTNGISSQDYNVIQINQFGADGVTPLTAGPGGIYPVPVLYLDAGNLEMVPEPGSWALMLGGLALLVIVQRSRNRNNS